MYKDCFACKRDGTEPKQGKDLTVIFDPTYIRHGTPTLSESTGWGVLSAGGIAGVAYRHGINYAVEEHEHTREGVLVACWWVGAHGRGKLHMALKDWAENAGLHLWHGCIQIPDPPVGPAHGEGVKP